MSDYEYRSSRAAAKNKKGGRINYAEPGSDIESDIESSVISDTNESDIPAPIKTKSKKRGSKTKAVKKPRKKKKEPLENDPKLKITNNSNNSLDSSSSGSESDIDEEPEPEAGEKAHKTKKEKGSRKRGASAISRASKKKKDDITESGSSNSDNQNGSDSGTAVKAKVKKGRGRKKKTKKERNLGRKKIKKIISDKDLQKQTKQAAREERERLKRLEELEKEKAESAEEPEEVEQTPEKKVLSSTCVFQKHPHVAVSEYIAQHLRPHQIEGVKFIYNNLVESVERVKTSTGSGCILAHCMGLGKTLQTIAIIHTLLKTKHIPFQCAMVVAPLNTVRNWIAEFVQWCEDGDELNLYNFAEPKNNKERVGMLRLWKEKGGVLILGYDMYRIMTTRIRYSGWKKTVQECMVDPGPDVVVCDEGHMLKNSTSHISKQISKMKTKRRLVLTGTPLQNNLIEYHCMVDFVKPDLLGSLKEFRNRFVNPIVNGQHIDSTERDVKVMKKRSHVLHQMLQGFVQRKDYSCLKPYLSSKYEYVLKVRLTPLQIKLYQHYLDTMTNRGANTKVVNSYGKGASLFSDYQNLMRVWTHPKSLLLHTVQRDKILARQAEWDFIADEIEGSETDEWSNSEGEEDEKTTENKENNAHENGQDENTKEQSESIEKNGTDSLKSKDEKDSQKVKSGDSSGSEEISSKKTRTGRREAVIKDKGDGWNSDEASTDNGEGDEKSGDSSDDEESDSESDLEKIPDRRTRTAANRRQRYRLRCVESDAEIDFLELESTTEQKEPEWYTDILPEDHAALENYQNSSKITILFEILRLSEERQEKVLVFSQSLISLDLIEEMLHASVDSPDENKTEDQDKSETKTTDETNKSEETPNTNEVSSPGKLENVLGDDPSVENVIKPPKRTWYKNIDYFRMDGATQGHHRQKWINAFNDENDTRSRLFLISTRAGSLGVNLVGANRVIIFDASWNPSHDTQSMFRVYRFGQTRKCYIYRLIAEGTMEEKIYQRQVNKQSLAFRVVDEQQINRHFTANSLAEMYTFNPTTPDIKKDEPTPIVPKDEVLADILSDPRTKYMIATYHEHDSLLDHQVDEELTEEERKAAWEEYEMIKKGHAPTISLQEWRQQNNLAAQQKSSSTAFKSMDEESSIVLLSRLSKMVANAFYQYQVCEVKSVSSIMKHLKETPLYSNSNDDTIKAIAVEVNYRLELQRNEKFATFQNLQRQFKQLQMQYFKQIGSTGTSVGSSLLKERPAGQSSVRIPTKDALLQHMASTSRTSSPTAMNGDTTQSQSSTTIEIVGEVDNNETKEDKTDKEKAV